MNWCLDLEPLIIFMLAAAIISFIRVFSELIFVNPHQVRIYNRLMSEWRRKAKEAMRSGNLRQIERVKREKTKIDSLAMTIFKMRFKSMMITFSLSIIIFIMIAKYFAIPILVPILGKLTGLWYFILCSLAWNSIGSIILKLKGYE